MDSRRIYETAKLISEIPPDRDIFQTEHQEILFSAVAEPSMLVSPPLPGQALSAVHVRFSESVSINFPSSSCYQLVFLNRGKGELRAFQQQVSLGDGEVFLFKPHRAFTLSLCSSVADLFLLRCDGHLPAFFQEILFSHQPHSVTANNPSTLCLQLEDIYFYIKKGGVDGAVRASHILSTVFTDLYTACNQSLPSHAPSWLHSLLKEWELAPEATYTTHALVKHYGISEATLYRTFKEHTGLSPQQYLQQLRLTRARLLLATTKLQVKYVAHSVGFHSASRFIDLFRKTYGETPAVYRKQHRR